MFCQKGVTFSFDSLEQDKKTWTYGGYSTTIVVDERYVLRIPKRLDPARAAPLLCAGITTYSPLHQFGCKPGDEVAVVGLGGLGHMAVKLAASMGANVTVLSTSPGKEEDAARLGAKNFIVTKEPGALDSLAGRFDLIIDTVSANHDINREVTLLRNFGTLILVGAPPASTPLEAFALIFGDKRIAGSNIGGIAETQEMLDYCGKHGVVADVEMIKMQDINQAYERMLKNDVKYRFVIDMASLKS
jgi:uncharacterized zinc-type alcohol dehydrogenase-like protein